MDTEIKVWTLFSLLNIRHPQKFKSLAIGQVSSSHSQNFVLQNNLTQVPKPSNYTPEV